MTWSFHSTDFPSEWGHSIGNHSHSITSVSIQLISPASGDIAEVFYRAVDVLRFPFNWFPQRVGTLIQHFDQRQRNLVSIQLISPASGDYLEPYKQMLKGDCFHSTDFPSEWGQDRVNMLMVIIHAAFPFNWFPQRVGTSMMPRQRDLL